MVCFVDDKQLRERLVERGLRATQQRVFILGLLAQERKHVSAEALVDRARCDENTACRASVYNALRSLVEVGLVRELNVKQGGALYELVRDSHHHLLCDGCGEVYDLEEGEAVKVELHPSSRAYVRSVEVTVRGLCTTCSQTGHSEKPRQSLNL